MAPIHGFDLERSRPRAAITVYPLAGVTRADYELEGVATGNVAGVGAYRQEYFAPRESSLPAGNGGEFRNRPDYTSSISASRCRRPSGCRTGGWRRVGFSTNRHTEHFDGDGGDPGSRGSTTWPNIEGGAYVTGTTGSGRARFI